MKARSVNSGPSPQRAVGQSWPSIASEYQIFCSPTGASGMMGNEWEGEGCRTRLSACARCKKLGRYCPDPGARIVRHEKQRRARRVHQQSPEGRADHRDRNRDYRRRLRAQRQSVMDTPSSYLAKNGNVRVTPTGVEKEVIDELGS